MSFNAFVVVTGSPIREAVFETGDFKEATDVAKKIVNSEPVGTVVSIYQLKQYYRRVEKVECFDTEPGGEDATPAYVNQG